MIVRIPVVIALALIASACGKLSDPQPKAPLSPMKQNSLDNPVVPAAPLPKIAADANPVPGPLPGQANDHSNPAFKDGGVPDPTRK
jgi:hypothetical protein